MEQRLADARHREESPSWQVAASARELAKTEQSIVQGYIMRACDESALDCPLYREPLRWADKQSGTARPKVDYNPMRCRG